MEEIGGSGGSGGSGGRGGVKEVGRTREGVLGVEGGGGEFAFDFGGVERLGRRGEGGSRVVGTEGGGKEGGVETGGGANSSMIGSSDRSDWRRGKHSQREVRGRRSKRRRMRRCPGRSGATQRR